ncbi:MAG TPA: tetratricopeptide repeat protein [Candidatus Hydrogenedentes bacterium]|nr:tetratricopeptide repeat protein [Candidatus Hydrogenedentota bacterium]HOL77194.1 tetratricopeptide repeat protein [Candidatus Hydrogenedentota bacterium]HPO85867.1 tetratricopeptide repeat protein [Candidatus Hydrogenedentota bacterium]
MDLSRVKWVALAALVVLLGWLFTEPGISYLHRKFTSDPGGDPKQAELNELGLSRLGGFLLRTLRYEWAERVFEDALRLYPDGKNSRYVLYRLAKVKEKRGDYRAAVAILERLMYENAHAIDDRVPNNDVLNLRRNKLVETHELGTVR